MLRGHANSFESLDYDLCDNAVFKAQEATSGPADPLLYRAAKYVTCSLIGLSIALAAFGVNLGVENIAGTKFWVTLQAVRFSYLAGWLVMITVQTALSIMAVCACLHISPAAAGSGIPDVVAYLNGIDVPAVFLFETLVAKVIGSLGSVGGGLAIGKEGPFVHIGACIASVISQGGASLWNACPQWLSRFRNDRERRDFVTCGAAAGVAAAFRAPVGGVLFALEELSSHWTSQLLLTCFFTTAVVSVTMRMIMNVCKHGGCGFFGTGDNIIFHIAEVDAQQVYEAFELMPMLLVGILGGLLGALFNYLNAHLTRLRQVYCSTSRRKLLDASLVAVISATVSFVLPLLVSCRECPVDTPTCPRPQQSLSGNFVAFGCSAPNEYNDLATLFFNTQDDAIRNLFSAGTPHEYSLSTLFLFFLFFYFLMIITYGITVPAGLFVPSVLVGACYGRLVGAVVRWLHPLSVVDESTYALLGAASYMAGSMRLVVATCVMLLELTNQLTLLPIMMLVICVARAVGDGSGVPGIYTIQTRIKEFPTLQPSPHPLLRHVTAGDVCSSSPPVVLPRIVRVDDLIHTLRSCQHNGFPVVHRDAASAEDSAQSDGSSSDQQLLGIILRGHLLTLLKSGRVFQHTPTISHASHHIAFMFTVQHFDKQVCMEQDTVEDVLPDLSPSCMKLYMDLKPYVNPASYIVQQSACATQTYSLFQKLGLRHLCVVRDTSPVVGVITRQDFMPEHVDGLISNRVQDERTEAAEMRLGGSSRR